MQFNISTNSALTKVAAVINKVLTLRLGQLWSYFSAGQKLMIQALQAGRYVQVAQFFVVVFGGQQVTHACSTFPLFTCKTSDFKERQKPAAGLGAVLMWQSQHSFRTVVPWQAPEFAFPSQHCPYPRSILSSCFVAWCAHPPATTACFTVLCGQTLAAFSPIPLRHSWWLWQSAVPPGTPCLVVAWCVSQGFAMLQHIFSPRHGEKRQVGCHCGPPKLPSGWWLKPKHCWSPVFHQLLAKQHRTWASSKWDSATCTMDTS